MEILIPGLILVALMVYASTKIKKRAAEAYAREEFDGDGFAIVKPDGFIIPAELPKGLLFSASSKDYGHEEADGFRQVSAEVRAHKDSTLENARETMLGDFESIGDEFTEKVDETTFWIAETRGSTDGVTMDIYHKAFERESRVVELMITAIAEHKDERSQNIEELMNSFTAK
jgi:hypothetical protein